MLAPDHRYRSGKIKREHTIADGTLPALEQIAKLDEVSAVIPGRIAQAAGGTPRVTFQYFTDSGMKLFCRTITSVQEVFVVCVDADGARAVKRKLEASGVLAEESADSGRGGRGRKARQPPAEARRRGSKRRPDRGRGGYPLSKMRNWQDDEDGSLSRLGPRIDEETRDALRRLRQRLK